MKRLVATLAVGVMLVSCSTPERETTEPAYYDTGVVHRAVTTRSGEAQKWFDRGLALCFGFNHAEAVVCFERAAQADPGCAMAYWGKAYALGPNYNDAAPLDAAMEAAYGAHQRAVQELDDETEAERALVIALGSRQAINAPNDRSGLDRAYADAMRRAHELFPDDADVAALTAEAVMQLRPWGLWSSEGVAAPETPQIRAILEPALERWPEHPALCHLYIHTMEAGPEVERAIPAARRLEGLTPGLGHLVHMPSHIYVWTGHYADVIRTNVEAVRVDDLFADDRGRANFYTAYRVHNYHFVAYGAMWDGQRELALHYARAIPGEIPAELIEGVPDIFEIFVATPYHVMVRFGMWEELLAEPEPTLPSVVAVWRYARGVAFASLGRVDEAERERAAFLTARQAVPESRLLFQNKVHDVLAVADKVLEGEIAYRKGEHDRAFALLREAVVLDEGLNYDEPWGWMEPVRHALGALLTEQRRYDEALAVYAENLERYPENGWALHGTAECLRGLGRSAEAARVQERFEAAWERSDTVIPGSCFCKTR
jgi:tetratricopeptide (TPR) repeat protein